MNLLEIIEKFAAQLASDFRSRGYDLQYAGTPLTPSQVGHRDGILPVILHHSARMMALFADGASEAARVEISCWLGGLSIIEGQHGAPSVSDVGTPATTPIAPILLFLNGSFDAAARLSPPGVIDFHTILSPPKSVIAHFLEQITHGDAIHPEAEDALGTAGGDGRPPRSTGPAGPDTGPAGPDTGPAGPDTGPAGPDTGRRAPR